MFNDMCIKIFEKAGMSGKAINQIMIGLAEIKKELRREK